MKSNVTMKDVAEAAGVSIASVSHFLNKKKGKLSDETAEKIMTAIKELGYEINIHARVLAKGRANLIGLILPITYKSTTSITLLKDNPFYSELYDGIAHTAFLKKYDIIISGFDKVDKCISWIRQRSVDGLIVVGMQPKFVEKVLSSVFVPVVMIDIEDKKTNKFFNIKTDDQNAILMAVQYLVSNGHRQIAYATGFLEGSYVNKARSLGYFSALSENGIKVDTGMYFEDYTSFEGGYRIGKQILKNQKKFTAVISSSDIMALGLIRSFHDSGLRVPDDISVIGFDDLKISSFLSPGLTTIKQHIEKKGALAAENVINEITQGTNLKQTVVVPAELIIRDTVKDIS